MHVVLIPISIPIVMLMKIIAANYLHILLHLVTNILQINNILQHPMLSAYIIFNILKRAMRCTITI